MEGEMEFLGTFVKNVVFQTDFDKVESIKNRLLSENITSSRCFIVLLKF